MELGGYTYMMTNKNNTVLYIGVTSNLRARIYEHKNKVYRYSFTARYNINKLIYYECYYSIEEAIVREKQLKGITRNKKELIINKFNFKWEDLYDKLED